MTLMLLCQYYINGLFLLPSSGHRILQLQTLQLSCIVFSFILSYIQHIIEISGRYLGLTGIHSCFAFNYIYKGNRIQLMFIILKCILIEAERARKRFRATLISIYSIYIYMEMIQYIMYMYLHSYPSLCTRVTLSSLSFLLHWRQSFMRALYTQLWAKVSTKHNIVMVSQEKDLVKNILSLNKEIM